MAKSKQKRNGKLLDCWEAPESAGIPVGCVATSFTFASDFFEEQCISRFVGMETDPGQDGALYLIEREEKLTELMCAGAIVDRHGCHGSRSLRWDLIAARPTQGLLHAKVAVLVWSEFLRIIITSANLTADGYRRNREVFGVLDYCPNSAAPLSALPEVTSFLRECLDTTRLDTAAGSRMRVEALLEKVDQTPESWGKLPESKTPVSVATLFSSPGRPPVLEQLRARWPVRTSPVKATVTSPFFDATEHENRPAKRLWEILAQRGTAEVVFNLEAEDVPNESAILLHAPESLHRAQPSGSRDLATTFRTIEPILQRPLHAKSIILESDVAITYMLGSSNFTSRGLGIANNSNYEANLVYSVQRNRNGAGARGLLRAQLKTAALPGGVDVRFMDCPSTDDAEGLQDSLPAFFRAATLGARSGEGWALVLQFDRDAKFQPESWFINDEESNRQFGLDEWMRDSRPQEVTVDWPSVRPPSGLWVHWGEDEKAWWPVNVASQTILPPPSQLRNLPLAALIRLLTSARPLHRAIEGILKQGDCNGDPDVPVAAHLDPHKKVNTSSFLLQRTRRFSGALKGIRERLERPVASEQSLHWRLHGPVGVMALVKALGREAHSTEEHLFLVAEIILELNRVKPKLLPGCLDPAVVRAAVADVAVTLQDQIRSADKPLAPNLKTYLHRIAEMEVLVD